MQSRERFFKSDYTIDNYVNFLHFDDERTALFAKYFVLDIVHDYYYKNNNKVAIPKRHLKRFLKIFEAIFLKQKNWLNYDEILDSLGAEKNNDQYIFTDIELKTFLAAKVPGIISGDHIFYKDASAFIKENNPRNMAVTPLQIWEVNGLRLYRNPVLGVICDFIFSHNGEKFNSRFVYNAKNVNNSSCFYMMDDQKITYLTETDDYKNSYEFHEINKFIDESEGFERSDAMLDLTKMIFTNYAHDLGHVMICLGMKDRCKKINVMLKSNDNLMRAMAWQLFRIDSSADY